MTRRSLALAVVFGLLSGACAASGGESSDESPSETCSRVAGVICQKLFECYSPLPESTNA